MKYVYFFGAGKADGTGDMREVLGGKVVDGLPALVLHRDGFDDQLSAARKRRRPFGRR